MGPVDEDGIVNTFEVERVARIETISHIHKDRKEHFASIALFDTNLGNIKAPVGRAIEAPLIESEIRMQGLYTDVCCRPIAMGLSCGKKVVHVSDHRPLEPSVRFFSHVPPYE